MPTHRVHIPVGTRVGRLVVTRDLGKVGRPGAWYLYRCLCDCGNEHDVPTGRLLNGTTRSCGCLQAESRVLSNLKHGGSQGAHPLYYTWKEMRQRCLNPANKHYSDYGGRGITVCERWADFTSFAADMDERPTTEHSIHRIDNDGNYEPSNCRWATPIEQRRNQRIYQSNRCRHGHEYTPDNTYRSSRGTRVCRTCAREATRRYLARKVVAA